MGVLSKVCAAGVLAVASHYAKAVENCETVEFNAAMAGEPEDLVTGQLCADAQVEGDVTTVTVDLVVDGNNPPAVFFGLELPADSYLMYKLDADGNENEAELAPILALGTRDVNKDTCVRSNGAEIDPCFFARRSPLAGNFPVGRCTSKKDYNNLKGNQYENKNVCRLASEQPGDYDDLEVTATSDGKMQFSLAPGVTLGDTTKLVYGAVIRDGNNGDQTSANGEEFGNVLEVALVADPDPNAPTAQPTVSTQAPSSAPTITTVAPTSAPTQVATEPPVAVTEEPVTEAPTVEDLGNETSAPTTSTETEDPTTVVTLPPVSVDTDAPTTAPTVASFTEETKVAKVLNGDGTMEYTIKEDGVVDVVLTVMDQPDFSGFLGVGVSPSGNMVGSKAYIGKMGGSSDGVERYSLNGKSASLVVPISRRRLQDEDCGTETAMYQDGDNLVLEFCAKEIDGEPLVDSDGKLRKMVVAHGDDPELSSAHSSDNRVTFDAATAEFVEGGNGNNGGNGGSSDGDDEDGIGGGAVAGIIIAVIVVAGLVGAGVVYSKKKGSGSSSSGNEGTPAKTANDVEKQSAGAAPGQTLHHQ